MLTPTIAKRQRGVALVIGMIMLVLITLLVVSAINSGSVNLRIAGNMQAEEGARAVAQQAIEQFIGVYSNFYPTPTAMTATSPNFDINNDGTKEYTVSIAAPTCKLAAKQVPGKSVDCINGARAGLFCWDTLWEVVATATDAKTGVSQVVTQGVSITFAPGFNPTSAHC